MTQIYNHKGDKMVTLNNKTITPQEKQIYSFTPEVNLQVDGKQIKLNKSNNVYQINGQNAITYAAQGNSEITNCLNN